MAILNRREPRILKRELGFFFASETVGPWVGRLFHSLQCGWVSTHSGLISLRQLGQHKHPHLSIAGSVA